MCCSLHGCVKHSDTLYLSGGAVTHAWPNQLTNSMARQSMIAGVQPATLLIIASKLIWIFQCLRVEYLQLYLHGGGARKREIQRDDVYIYIHIHTHISKYTYIYIYIYLCIYILYIYIVLCVYIDACFHDWIVLLCSHPKSPFFWGGTLRGALTPHQCSAPHRLGGGWCGRTGSGLGPAELGAESDLRAAWRPGRDVAVARVSWKSETQRFVGDEWDNHGYYWQWIWMNLIMTTPVCQRSNGNHPKWPHFFRLVNYCNSTRKWCD